MESKQEEITFEPRCNIPLRASFVAGTLTLKDSGFRPVNMSGAINISKLFEKQPIKIDQETLDEIKTTLKDKKINHLVIIGSHCNFLSILSNFINHFSIYFLTFEGCTFPANFSSLVINNLDFSSFNDMKSLKKLSFTKSHFFYDFFPNLAAFLPQAKHLQHVVFDGGNIDIGQPNYSIDFNILNLNRAIFLNKSLRSINFKNYNIQLDVFARLIMAFNFNNNIKNNFTECNLFQDNQIIPFPKINNPNLFYFNKINDYEKKINDEINQKQYYIKQIVDKIKEYRALNAGEQCFVYLYNENRVPDKYLSLLDENDKTLLSKYFNDKNKNRKNQIRTLLDFNFAFYVDDQDFTLPYDILNVIFKDFAGAISVCSARELDCEFLGSNSLNLSKKTQNILLKYQLKDAKELHYDICSESFKTRYNLSEEQHQTAIHGAQLAIEELLPPSGILNPVIIALAKEKKFQINL